MIAALADHLWQSTVFGLVAALLVLLLRKNAARVRHGVWLAASIKFLIPFPALTFLAAQLVPLWRSSTYVMPEQVAGAVLHIAEPLGTSGLVTRAAPAEGASIEWLLLAVWALGSAAFLARWLIQSARIRAAARLATPARVKGPIDVRSTSMLWEPCVVGIRHPVLLLPRGIEARLTRAQLRAILTHEICHVRRRDNLTSAIHMIVEVLFWFHPLVWWIGARLVEERERACDEAVVGLGGEPQAYAEGILKVCRFYMESRLACVSGVSGAGLRKRIEVIMRNRVVTNLTVAQRVMLASFTGAAVALPLVIGLAASTRVTAQIVVDAPSRPAFEQVSIAQAVPESARAQAFMSPEGGLSVRNRPLRELIALAYEIDVVRVIGGPDWLDKPAYDIVATTTDPTFPSKPYPDAMRAMLRTLLADRFGLVTHTEVRPLPAWVLRVDDGGSKLKPVSLPERPGAVPGRGISVEFGRFRGHYMNAKMIESFLSRQIRRPVIDRTGLKGYYDFILADASPPQTFQQTVRDQLGLVLEPSKEPVEVLAIDSMHAPTVDVAASALADAHDQIYAAAHRFMREDLAKAASAPTAQ